MMIHRPTLHFAFVKSLPIMAGFLFLGMAYGVYMHALGFGAWYPILMSMIIFAGSVEFIVAGMLVAAFNPWYAFLLIAMISGRQVFYGISMLDKFKDTKGCKRWYLICAMVDESFAINYTTDIPDGVDATDFMLWVTILLHIYWVAGSALGALVGAVLPVDLTGSEFAMTALFIVIFLEQWQNESFHESSLIGIGFTALALVLFGKTHFLLPAMAAILIWLGLRKPVLAHKITPPLSRQPSSPTQSSTASQTQTQGECHEQC